MSNKKKHQPRPIPPQPDLGDLTLDNLFDDLEEAIENIKTEPPKAQPKNLTETFVEDTQNRKWTPVKATAFFVQLTCKCGTTQLVPMCGDNLQITFKDKKGATWTTKCKPETQAKLGDLEPHTEILEQKCCVCQSCWDGKPV